MIDYEEMFRGAMQARAMVANPDQWADSDRDQVNTRHYLSTSMRVALDRGEFFLVYQPIIRLADNRIIGAEALLRWEHPTLGTLLPGRVHRPCREQRTDGAAHGLRARAGLPPRPQLA